MPLEFLNLDLSRLSYAVCTKLRFVHLFYDSGLVSYSFDLVTLETGLSGLLQRCSLLSAESTCKIAGQTD